MFGVEMERAGGQRFAHAVGDGDGLLLIGLRKDDAELVAAEAHDLVDAAHHGTPGRQADRQPRPRRGDRPGHRRPAEAHPADEREGEADHGLPRGRPRPGGRGAPGTDPVHKITILPRGRALGYTMVLPDEDKYSVTRSEMLDQLAYMMGGRAAEEMVFHDPTTGAGNDIEKATSVARAMVTQYGMTDRLGAIKLGCQQRGAVHGPRHGPHPRLLRGRRRDRRRGDQEVPRGGAPGGLRHPRAEPRRPRRAGARAAGEGDPRQGAGGRDLHAAAPPRPPSRMDRVARP